MKNRIKKAWRALLGRDVKNYGAAEYTRLTADWPTSIASPNAVISSSLSTLRARSRNLAMNNDYARRFLWMVGVHVIGPNSIQLQCKAKYPDGKLDKWANDKIESAWAEWGRKGNFDVTGTLSMLDGDRLFAQATARDGESIIRIIEDFKDNQHGFAVQFLEPDHLDESLTVARLSNGNSIRMGVELNAYGRPVAYHLLAEHPGDNVWRMGSRNYTRVPAENIIHPYITERFGQCRGVPWMHSAMTRLNNLGAYEEAEIIAARIGASKMGFYELEDTADTGDVNRTGGTATTQDSAGRPLAEVEPGLIETLPRGYKFHAADWNHPAGNFSPFMKASLRGIASGLLVSYNSLASDLEGVNYSSIRAGVLEERDVWKMLQGWTIENYKQPIYRRWLRWMLLTGQVNLPLSKVAKFETVQWMPRTWAWVDPEKDINAQITAIENGLTSRTRVAAENGMDFEELLVEIKQEQELVKKYGVTLEKKEAPAPQPAKPEPPHPDEEEEGMKEKAGANNAR